MKITAFNGSPRGDMSVTDGCVREFLDGAREGGASVSNVLLVKKRIRHCSGCFSCWVRTPGECAIQDDMKTLISVFLASDVVVFASPLYVDNVTGIMKNFMDRLIPILDPHFARDEGGECRHQLRAGRAPKIVVMSNAGFPERSHFQVLHLLFKRVARNLGTQVIAEIYRGAGWAIQNPEFIRSGLSDEYLETIRQAGLEIARTLTLTDEIRRRLERPILPDDDFIGMGNHAVDVTMERNGIRRDPSTRSR